VKVKTKKRISSARKTFSFGLRDTFVGIGKNLLASWKTLCRHIFKAFIKIFIQTPVDAFLLFVGKFLSSFQVLFGVEIVGRNLTSNEITTLYKIFRDSIKYDRVRIKEDKLGLFRLIHAPFTHGDTIYVQPNWVKNESQKTQLLVHETVHVWQHQNRGTNYMSESIFAQTWGILRTGNRGSGYDFVRGISEGKSFERLNPEQQASIIETSFCDNFFENETRKFTYCGNDYTEYLENALKIIRKQKLLTK
jgi:Domain of unknown function (DUF4157)